MLVEVGMKSVTNAVADLNNSSFVDIRNLRVYFKRSYDVYTPRQHGKHVIKAVDDVTIQIARGEILSIVGESGSGKTTLGRTVVGLTRPTSGKVLLEGNEINYEDRGKLRELWKKSQMIFQDPYSTFNPLSPIHDALLTPLKKFGLVRSEAEADERIESVLLRIGLSAKDVENKYPNQLSGGQRQRISIARAMLVQPKLLVADEPVSMLDVSLRAGILELIKELNRKDKLTVLFITHDLAVAQYISDRIAVMYRGKILELGSSHDIIDSPLHPYTELLLSSVPRISGRKSWPDRSEISLPKVVPNDFAGCRYYANCPLAVDRCKVQEPSLKEVYSGHFVACFLRDKSSEIDSAQRPVG
jgi:oligopeptide/dipeptide ABC transporter ATP-binding protein